MTRAIVQTFASLLLLIGLFATSGVAQAQFLNRDFAQNATGSCQAALPAFEGQIRKRPLAVQNEGTASAFVTCSFMGTNQTIGGGISGVELAAANRTNSDIVLTCTMIAGTVSDFALFFPKTITLPANSTFSVVRWTASDDNGGSAFGPVTNVSCNLPVGAGLVTSTVAYREATQ